MMWLVAAWLFLLLLLWLFIAAANGARSLWLHVHWPVHKQRMRRAELCLEAAGWFTRAYPDLDFGHVRTEAVRLCSDCGCPADLWPVGIVRLHVGADHA